MAAISPAQDVKRAVLPIVPVTPKLSLAEIVELSLESVRGKPLNYAERKYFISKFKTIDIGKFKAHPIKRVVDVLTQIFITDLPSVHNEDISSIDMHEVLNREIGVESESSIMEKKVSTDATVDSLLQQPKTLQRIFNPKAVQKSVYMILDSRYRDRTVTDPTILRWSVTTPQGNFMPDSSALTTMPLRDIISMNMTPFRFPNARNAITNSHRVSVEIIELNSQSMIANRGQKRIHFMFNINETDSPQFSPYELTDIGNAKTHFKFHTPIVQLDTISLRFGNPLLNIALDPDQLYATVSPIGVQTLLTFSQPHYCVIGDEVILIDFTTDAPNADKPIIDILNDINGHAITAAPVPNVMRINVDITGLTGVIPSTTLIYLNSKRIICNMEFTHVFDG